jgi:hypothetical protein
VINGTDSITAIKGTDSITATEFLIAEKRLITKCVKLIGRRCGHIKEESDKTANGARTILGWILADIERIWDHCEWFDWTVGKGGASLHYSQCQHLVNKIYEIMRDLWTDVTNVVLEGVTERVIPENSRGSIENFPEAGQSALGCNVKLDGLGISPEEFARRFTMIDKRINMTILAFEALGQKVDS